jgi:peptide/nickel transport system permease protein
MALARAVLGEPVGFASAVLVAGMAVLAGAAPWLSGTDPNQISSAILAPPLTHAVLGTDELGRDVLVGLVYGLRVSLLVGLLAAATATLVGIAIGALAGYFGSWLDMVMMRVTEVFQVMPSFILAAVIVALLGPGLTRVVLVIAVLSWPEVARVMRGEVLRVKQLEYVDAVRCLGIGELAVMVGEVIPNALGPVLAVGSLIIGRAILLEASLSFFGLSSPDAVSWGRMANSGQQLLFSAWWLSVFPGVAIFVTVLVFNLLGDTLGRALDPRSARS